MVDSAQNNLGQLLEAALPVALRHVPLRIRDVARELDLRVALVGGVPRDLLRVHFGQLTLDQFSPQLLDFDLVVEGPTSPKLGGAGVRFAYELRRRLPGEITVNEAFHTATLTTEDPLRLDIATARTEEYESPGQLPTVHVGPVTIEEDLLRRDFAVNAIALDLSHDYGHVLDPLGGAGDIQDQLVRVLHGLSFVDDPTRLLRAVRYSMRLGYDLEPITHDQFSTAVQEAVLDFLTPERIRYEYECCANEDRWAELFAVLDISGINGAVAEVLEGISRRWELDDAKALDIALNNQRLLLKAEGLPRWLVRLAWVLKTVPAAQLAAAAGRLGLYERQQRWLIAAREVLTTVVPRLAGDAPPSTVTRMLERYVRQGVVLAMFIYQPRSQAGVETRKALKRYLEKYSKVRSELTGEELMSLGLKPGPALGRIRDQLRYLRLDGAITSMEEERTRAEELIAEKATPGNGKLDEE